tara:strand:- start:166 stop:615 length:450 start_codon:yes stop_codon:yes gene_type:complete
MSDEVLETHKISEVPRALVPMVWGQVSALFQPSVDLSDGECSLDAALKRIMSGEHKLIVVVRGDLVTFAHTVEVITYETGQRELSIPLSGGNGELDSLKEIFMPSISELAKINNCTSIVMQSARAGWARKLKPYGWTPVREILKFRVGE